MMKNSKKEYNQIKEILSHAKKQKVWMSEYRKIPLMKRMYMKDEDIVKIVNKKSGIEDPWAHQKCV